MAQGRKSTMVRKKQIMDAARKLIMRSGSEHVTIKNMAKEVGISDSAIYRHFKSKRKFYRSSRTVLGTGCFMTSKWRESWASGQ